MARKKSRKAKASPKKSKSKTVSAKRKRPAAKRGRAVATKRTAKKSKRKAAPKAKVKRAAKPAKKAAAPKAKAKPAAKAKDVVGEGNYTAARNFRASEEKFVHRNKKKIPELGKQAEAALEGPEGDDLRRAEDEARSHAQ